MANGHGNPEVKEWMKEHKEEVEKVQTRYDELKEVSLQGLLEAASLADADVSRIRGILIAKIISSESKRGD